MLIGARQGDNRPPAAIVLGQANFGLYPMGNGLTRLATRFLGEPQSLERAEENIGTPLEAEAAEADGFAGTDEASLLERAGIAVAVVPGSARNFKITQPGDIELAEFYLGKA